MNQLDATRAFACLAPTVSRLTVHGSTPADETLVVSRLRYDGMDPCRLGAVVLVAERPGWPCLHDVIASLQVVGAAGTAARTRLDEVPSWLLSSCPAEELVTSIGEENRP